MCGGGLESKHLSLRCNYHFHGQSHDHHIEYVNNYMPNLPTENRMHSCPERWKRKRNIHIHADIKKVFPSL